MSTVTIDDYDEVRDALRNPHLAQSLYDAGRMVMADVLLTLHGDAHRQRRLTEFAVFQRGFFRHYEQQVFPNALAETLQPYVERGRMDLVEFGYRITMNLTADFAGIDRPERSVDETDALLSLVRTFSEGATLVHSRRDPRQVEAEVAAAMEVFEARFLEPSRARREGIIKSVSDGKLDPDDLPRDVMTVLLDSGAELAPDVFRREMAFYLQAGAHSTANSTTHALHEIFTWAAGNDERRSRLDDPLFLQRAVHESLRLHPASPVAWRRAIEPTIVGNGIELPAGEQVVLDLMAANRQSDVFGADAADFNPDRTLAHGVRPFGLTFGYGVHTCLGRDLDGGVVPRPATDPGNHQYGIVTMLVSELLHRGARPDPDHPPTPDESTARANWGSYPVVFA